MTTYRDEPGITCTNIYHRDDRLGYVFQFKDNIADFPQAAGRWYFNASHLLPPDANRNQPREGYATYDDARQALIDVWEAHHNRQLPLGDVA